MSNLKVAPSPPAPKRKFTLNDVTKGRQNVPLRILGYGAEKVGKSTFASGAPGAVFLGPDGGTPHLDIERLPSPETWEEVLELVALVETNPAWKTLVIDPVNWLEDLISARIVDGPNSPIKASTREKIEEKNKAFFKVYEAAVSYWRILTSELEQRHLSKGRNVILMAHAKKENFKDPVGASYERYEIALYKTAAGLLRQWADDVLFFRHEILAKPENGKTVAIATDERIIHTAFNKAWDAGNRSSLPEELPMSWDAYWEAVEAGRAKAGLLKAEIESLLAEIGDAALTKRVRAAVESAKGNVEKLTKYASELRIRKEEKS